MTEEAKNHRNDRQHRGGDVRGSARLTQMSAKDGNKNWQTCQSNKRTGAVDPKTANPFDQVVSLGSKNEPLIPQESHTNRNEIRENGRIHIAIGTEPREQPIEECEDSITKEGVKSTHENVAHKLPQRFGRAWFHVGKGT